MTDKQRARALPQPEGDEERMTGREVALRHALTAKDAEIESLKGEVAFLDKCRVTLENLTAGGSEFYRNPQACDEYIRYARDGQHERLIKAVKAEKAATARIAELEIQLQTVLNREADNIRRADTRIEAAEARIAELEAERDWLRAENERLRAALNKLSNNHCADCRETARAALTPKEQEVDD